MQPLLFCETDMGTEGHLACLLRAHVYVMEQKPQRLGSRVQKLQTSEQDMALYASCIAGCAVHVGDACRPGPNPMLESPASGRARCVKPVDVFKYVAM